ncbi:M50 family metallopeptidase [Haloimpatiens lingqiaonensis]|uniref:M50 family metallopeptidase n=1 Tax=Haloimpatiens lingqiaonensis TaxID=1380675 RepID=UPI0010FF59F1|nr:M50 family metallopeptidase [Haloimpatiens lingqiaonensis]
MVKFKKYFFLIFLCLLVMGFRGKFLVAFIMAFLHEVVHYVTARFLGFSGFDIEIWPIGTVLKLKDLDEATPLEDIIISVSGPLFNIIVALAFHIFFNIFKLQQLRLLEITNLALGIFNLIPALPLDGGRILRDLLNIKIHYKRANIITVNFSLVIGFAFIFYYFLLFYKKSIFLYNLNIGLIGLFIIVYSSRERERIVYLIMGDVIKKRVNFLKRGYLQNRTVSVCSKKNLLFMMNLIDKNRYNIFYVLNDEMNVIDIIYEQEIIDALKVYGNITIEEYLRLKLTIDN